MAELKDSGNRREFDSGAVRDMAEGKGRCDLLPLDAVTPLFKEHGFFIMHLLGEIETFKTDSNTCCLLQVLHMFASIRYQGSFETMLLEVAKHFEDGARKYGDDNWKKGIPVNVYIDSATRHLLKFLRGDDDEPHDRAFCWNIICAIWTAQHMPELNPYPKKDGDED